MYATAAVAPADVAFDDTEDLHLGTQRVAGALVRHLRLPEARVIVTFREMTHAANVELTAGPEYFVETYAELVQVVASLRGAPAA